jgi:hypothetical protein
VVIRAIVPLPQLLGNDLLGNDLKYPAVTQTVTKSVRFTSNRDTTDGTANDHKISRSRQNTRSGGRKRSKRSFVLE